MLPIGGDTTRLSFISVLNFVGRKINFTTDTKMKS